MFGFQRIGDLVWAGADMRTKGFLIGGTAGRTTLNGEGLQHQDGHSHHLAYPVPTLLTYDPAFAFELAVIIREGIRRMYEEQESIFYYITVMNENYAMPPMPEGVKEGIVKGLYKFRSSEKKKLKLKVNLLGNGTIMNEVLKAQEILEERYGVAADIYSATSYKELRREALEVERWNMLNPGEPKQTYISKVFEGASGVFVASSDYIKAIPDSISKWVPGRLITLGTDGFGRSEGRKELRDFFEVDARFVTVAALYGLMLEGKVKQSVVDKAIEELDIDKNKLNPMIS
jgi:pyruvate dehydrogenase E1 component